MNPELKGTCMWNGSCLGPQHAGGARATLAEVPAWSSSAAASLFA